VIDGDKVAGIVDESDILLRVYEHEERFREPVRTAMTDKIETVEAGGDLAALIPIFDQDRVALVMDEGRFLGIITRIDLLNHLRQRMK
jgi:cystathionine beta-synthase